MLTISSCFKCIKEISLGFLLVISPPLALATDFTITNNTLAVIPTPTQNLSVSSSGAVVPTPFVQAEDLNFGVPSFSFGLTASDISVGEHIYWAAIEIEGADNDAYLRAFIDELFLTVAADGSFAGDIKSTTNLTVRAEGDGEFLQIELDNQASRFASFAGQNLTFDAGNLLSLLGDAVSQSAQWQRLVESFTADLYRFRIYLGPREYGVQGGRIGVNIDNSFEPLPLETADFLGNDEAYFMQGTFFIDSFVPVLFNLMGSAGNELVTLRGGVSTNEYDYFQQAVFSVGETIYLGFGIEPPPAHLGAQALIAIGLIDQADPDTFFLVSSNLMPVPFDGQTVTAYSQTALQDSNSISFPAIELTPGLGGVYEFYVGYQLLSTGEVFYSSEPVVVEVNE